MGVLDTYDLLSYFGPRQRTRPVSNGAVFFNVECSVMELSH